MKSKRSRDRGVSSACSRIGKPGIGVKLEFLLFNSSVCIAVTEPSVREKTKGEAKAKGKHTRERNLFFLHLSNTVALSSLKRWILFTV